MRLTIKSRPGRLDLFGKPDGAIHVIDVGLVDSVRLFLRGRVDKVEGQTRGARDKLNTAVLELLLE